MEYKKTLESGAQLSNNFTALQPSAPTIDELARYCHQSPTELVPTAPFESPSSTPCPSPPPPASLQFSPPENQPPLPTSSLPRRKTLPVVPPPPLTSSPLFRARTDPFAAGYTTSSYPYASTSSSHFPSASAIQRSATLPSTSRADRSVSAYSYSSSAPQGEDEEEDRPSSGSGLVRRRTRFPPRPLPNVSYTPPLIPAYPMAPRRPQNSSSLSPEPELSLAPPPLPAFASRHNSNSSSRSGGSTSGTSGGGATPDSPTEGGGRKGWLRGSSSSSGTQKLKRKETASPATRSPPLPSSSSSNRPPPASNRPPPPSNRAPPPPSGAGRAPFDPEIEEAIRASQEDAEIDLARKASVRAQEEFQYRLVVQESSHSAEQEQLRLQRLAEERSKLEQVLGDSLREERENKERKARSEEEQMELVIALSLSEISSRQEGGRAQTSSEIFNRLARGPDVVVQTSAEVFDRLAVRTEPTTTTGSTPIRTPSFRLANPDPEDGPPLPRRPQPSLPVVPPRPTPHLPTPSSSASSSSSDLARPSISHQSSFNASSFYSSSVAAATATPSTLGDRAPLSLSPDAFSTSRQSSNSSANVNGKQRGNDDDNDPFSDKMAIVLSTEDVPVSWDTTSDEEDNNQGDDVDSDNGGGSTVIGPSSTIVGRLPQPSILPSPTSPPTISHDLWESLDEHSSDSSSHHYPIHSSSPSASQQPQHRPPLLHPPSSNSAASAHSSLSSQPSHGGFVDFSNTNAVADDGVLTGIKFGFVRNKNVRGGREALEFEGPFPDKAQLSSMDDQGKPSDEFSSLAVEASGWQPLLTFLMWHGYSQIEPAPRDLQLVEKSREGLKCSVTVDFYRDVWGNPRVRCRVDLLLPGVENAPFSAYSSFFPESPSITVRLPLPPQLPLLLSRLATTLSAANTVSRNPRRLRTGEQLPDGGNRSLKDLPKAIDLFRQLNGEKVVADAEEAEEEEAGLMQKMRWMLKRKKKGPGLVKGGADGTGEGVPLEGTDAVPEAALLVTPFRLDE